MMKREKNKIVIYTAIFGDKDGLKDPPDQVENCDFICFTDSPSLRSEKYQIRLVKPIYEDPTRNARMYKILSNRFLPEYEYTIWMDGNIIVNADFEYIKGMIDRYLKDANLAMFMHPDRNCVYKEADACVQLKKDDPEMIKRQMERYEIENYPKNNGLIMSSVVFRRNLAPDVIKLNEDWWNEIICFSKRDQLSFNFVAWKNKFKFNIIPGNAYDDEYFIRIRHRVNESVSSFNEVIKIKNEEIKKLTKEIGKIKTSKLWKMINVWGKTKSAVFHPIKSFNKALHVIKRDGIVNFFRYLSRRIKRTLTN